MKFFADTLYCRVLVLVPTSKPDTYRVADILERPQSTTSTTAVAAPQRLHAYGAATEFPCHILGPGVVGSVSVFPPSGLLKGTLPEAIAALLETAQLVLRQAMRAYAQAEHDMQVIHAWYNNPGQAINEANPLHHEIALSLWEQPDSRT